MLNVMTDDRGVALSKHLVKRISYMNPKQIIIAKVRCEIFSIRESQE